MTVVVRHSKSLNLNFVECTGIVTTEQLGALAQCAAKNPMLLESDSLNVVRPCADLSGVDMAALGALYARFQTMFAPVKVQVYRRTAWVCESPTAMAHVAFWDRGDESRKSFSSNTRHLNSMAEAAEWLLLNAAERGDIESGDGFSLIARFDDAPTQTSAAR